MNDVNVRDDVTIGWHLHRCLCTGDYLSHIVMSGARVSQRNIIVLPEVDPDK